MPGYLDQYGAGEEKRNRLIVRAVVSVLAVVIVTGLGWYLLKNHHQESVVKGFLGDLSRGDYQAAYRDWGCGSGKPCTGYDYQKFLSDWGPAPAASTAGGSSVAGGAPDSSVLGLTDSESCNNGVLLTVEVNRTRMEKLWVDKASDSINFAPYPICPHKNPFAIMIHRTIGQLRKPLLK
jgi:hypothetical protein